VRVKWKNEVEMLEDEFTLYVYTDGSFYFGPDKGGGVGILFVYPDERGKERTYEFSPPGYIGGSNNEMEIKACTIALNIARKNSLFANFHNIVVLTDSMFLKDFAAYAEKYWAHNGWKKRNGLPVENKEEWKEYLQAKRKLGKPVEFRKVKAHAQNRYNNRVDKLAKESAKFPLLKSLQRIIVRRKKSPKKFIAGCVPMQGQIMTIRIYRTKILDIRSGVEKHWYEVVDQASKYYLDCDAIYSALPMRVGHCYRVKVNQDNSAPSILEILEEIEKITTSGD
jgi:ribonuclease HI